MLYFWQNDTFSICSTRVVMVFQQSCFCTKFQENITHIIVWDSTSLCPVLRLWYMTIMILLWFLLSLILWQFFFVRSYPVRFSSVQSLSRVWLFAWTAAHQASLSITNSQSLPKFLSIKWWCHPIISSFVISFSSHLQSFQSSGSFPMSQFFTSGGLNIGVSASASVLLIEYSGLIFLGWTGWISLQSKGLSSLLKHHSSKASILQHSAFLIVQLSHTYMTTGETTALTRWTFVSKVMSLGLGIFIWLSRGFSSVQSLSRVRLSATPWPAALQASLSFTNSRSSPKLMSIELVMPSSHLILCRPLFILTPIPPSIRVFSNELTLHMRWPKYWSFSFSISPSKEHPGLIAFRMDWLDFLAVQGTLKSLLQHHSSKASILQRSAFFTVQFSHPYMTTGKTIALSRGLRCGKKNPI